MTREGIMTDEKTAEKDELQFKKVTHGNYGLCLTPH